MQLLNTLQAECVYVLVLLFVFRQKELTAGECASAGSEVVRTAQKMNLSIKDFFSKRDQIRTAFTEETFNGKIHFLCSDVMNS